MADGESASLTPDQQAIIRKIAKSAPAENVHYARAPTDPIGEKVTLPLREGNDIKVNVGLDPERFTYQSLTRFGK